VILRLGSDRSIYDYLGIGVPNGDNSSCEDECGVVNGDSSSCVDRCNVPNGDGESCLDECDIAFGDNTSCADDCGKSHYEIYLRFFAWVLIDLFVCLSCFE
jgi:hypothetical protein